MNLLHNVRPERVEKVSETEVAFFIDLTKYPFLGDPNVLAMCMNDYAGRYPSVSAWRAKSIEGMLVIGVAGTIDWSVLDRINND